MVFQRRKIMFSYTKLKNMFIKLIFVDVWRYSCHHVRRHTVVDTPGKTSKEIETKINQN